MNPLLILRLAANDCKAKFAGSFLGSLWACAGPIVTVCVYWFIYTTALKGTPINGVPYVLWLISGIIPWFFLSDSICSAASCFNDYRFLVRKTRFKSEFLPLIRVISSALVNIPIFVIAYFVITIGGIKPSCGQLWLIYWTLGSFVFIHGLSRITAVLCVYIKDLVYGTVVIVQLGFWVTPVFWNVDLLSPILKQICFLNPAAIIVEGFRTALIYGENLPPAMQAYFWGLTVLINLIAYLVIKKSIPTIADKL